MKPHSKVIQITQIVGSADVDLIAVTADGEVWSFRPNAASKWKLLYEPPQAPNTPKAGKPPWD